MLSRSITQIRSPRLYLSLLLGASLGVVVYSYLLADFLPPTSRSIILYTALICLVAWAGYYVLLRLVALPKLSGLTGPVRALFIGGSVFIGLYLTFAYLADQGSPPRYIGFLLPRESLRISVPAGANAPNAKVVITRFTTSLGDVSYGSLKYRGWTRDGSDLVLTDASGNALEWSGRTGETASITFQTADQPLVTNIAWNGKADKVIIPAGGNGRYQSSRSFSLPFYCSQAFLLLLGALNFIALCSAATLLLWKSRDRIQAGLESSLAELQQARNPETAPSAGQILRSDWPIIAGLIALALLLRVFRLGELYPYADEYAHLLAARALLTGAPLNSVFERSLLITTLPVVLSQRLFGMDLWSARLPGTIFNALAILPLYLLARKINRPIAVLSCFLFATSPWIIGVARNIREYAAYPFYFYWIVYAMLLLLERLPRQLVLFRDWKVLLRAELRLPASLLLLAPVYAVFLDARSTFKIIAIAYGVFGLFLLRKLDLKNRVNLGLFALLGVGLAAGGTVYAGVGHLAVPLAPHFNADVFTYFFPNPPQQWYFDRPALLQAAALVAAAALSVRTFRSNLVPSFLVALLLASALFFTVFFGHYLRPRYLMIMQFWYVVVLALGLYSLFVLLAQVPRQDLALPLLTVALCGLTFNLSQSLVPTLYDKQGNMPITEEYHYDLGPVVQYMQQHVNKQDALLSNVYGGYVRWKGTPTFREIYPYSFVYPSVKYWGIFPYEAAEVLDISPTDYIQSVVQADGAGWIVLDSVTYSASLSKPLPLKTMVAGNTEIDYVGYFGGEYVWKWLTARPAP